MKTSLATCPESLSVSLPLFSTDTIMYIQWNPDSGDILPLQLHHESLSVPPSVVINHTVIDHFDELYEYYDSQLSSTLDKADSMINQIEVTTETTFTDYLVYATCGLSALYFILFCIVFRCFHRIISRRPAAKPASSSEPVAHELSPPIISTPAQHQKICRRCYKPVKKSRQESTVNQEPQH